MSRLGPVLVLAGLVGLVLLPPRPASAEPTVITLEGIDKVTGLQRADTNGDGVVDLLLLSDRALRVWGVKAGADRAILPKPRHTWTVPEDVSFVIGPFPGGADRTPGAETVTWLGTAGMRPSRGDALPGDDPVRQAMAQASLGWRDGAQATFADFDRGPHGWLVPTAAGWLHSDGVRLDIPRTRKVKAPGPFLEDTCVVENGLPRVFVGRPARTAGDDGGQAIWALADRTLIAQTRAARVTYDLGFLGAGEQGEFDQTLVDLDGDERPEILHRIFTNRQVHYGFFRTQAAKAEVGPTHKPANCRLSLQGFQLDPEFVDLNADGRKDLVITSMLVNAANMIGALSKGLVVAETRAFLNRSAEGGTYFVSTPDATIQSEIGVKVRFNYAGNIEVIRTLMIVTDGDFDGDGRKDLAIRTGPETVSIRKGRATGVWAGDDAIQTVAIPPMGDSRDVEGYAADLDGDGKDELILVYRGPEDGRDTVRIVRP